MAGSGKDRIMESGGGRRGHAAAARAVVMRLWPRHHRVQRSWSTEEGGRTGREWRRGCMAGVVMVLSIMDREGNKNDK